MNATISRPYWLFWLVIFEFLAGDALAATNPDPLTACQEMYEQVGLPEPKGTNPESTILCRKGYILSHHTEYRTPIWVLERLTAKRFKGTGDRKGVPFREDPTLLELKEEPATNADYVGFSFDKGHMSPAADNKFTMKATEESFYLSNMSPQVGKDLNRHIWADLEKLVRDWTCDHTELVVITGPIYDREPLYIGRTKSEVAVPDAFYKVIYDPAQRRVLSFILPNKAIPKKGRKPEVVLDEYRATVREVEERASLDLFEGLPLRERRRMQTLKSPVWGKVNGCKR